MMKIPPQHNIEHPPGQVVNESWKPPKYLKDVIQRVQYEEHPTPQPDYKDALKRLLEALVRQCENAEAVSGEAGVTTAWIRRIVTLNKDRYFP